MDEIRIHGLDLCCIVGIHPHERLNEQPLCIDLTLGVDTRDAARTGKISRTVHYGDVAEQVSALLRFRKYRLLEAAAEEIAWMLLGIHPRLEWVQIRVTKPKALEGLADAASLSVTRYRKDLAEIDQAGRDTTPLVMQHSVVLRDAELGVAALSPGQRLELTKAGSTERAARRRLFWVLGGTVWAGGRQLATSEHHCDDVGEAPVMAGSESARVFFCHTNKDAG